METPIILATKDSAAFNTRQVLISQDSGVITMQPCSSVLNFKDMMALRNMRADPKTIEDSVRAGGYVFANVGLSGLFTTTYQGKDFVLCVMQDRRMHKDFNDIVIKNLSGYIETNELSNPAGALRTETAEEFLPFTKDGKIVPGIFNGTSLDMPFSNIAGYASGVSYQVSGLEKEIFTLPGLSSREIFLRDASGKATPLELRPRLHYHAPTNSAQLIYPCSIQLQQDAELTLNHSEDKFNPNTKKLDVVLQREGIYLLRLENGKLTGEIYTLRNGVLVPQPAKDVTLSEAFAPKPNHICEVQNIKLEDYLASQ